MIALNEFPYNLLVLAFAAGLWILGGSKRRTARIAAAGLVGYAAFGFVAGTITPMTTREVMAAGEATTRNTLHAPLTMVMSLALIVAMIFAARLLGKRFRYYTIATIAVLIAFGVLTSLQVPQMEANEPTPWMGLAERVNIYATMLWIAALAVGLLRSGPESSANSTEGKRSQVEVRTRR
jgi:cell division protein FtsW (lipid II flippase)